MTDGPPEISDTTRERVRAIFAVVDREDAERRASMTPEEYRRDSARRDIAYCRERLDPDFALFVEHPQLRPDAATMAAYRSRIRDLEHFLATGSHLDENDI
jgi:hypothetical protein